MRRVIAGAGVGQPVCRYRSAPGCGGGKQRTLRQLSACFTPDSVIFWHLVTNERERSVYTLL